MKAPNKVLNKIITSKWCKSKLRYLSGSELFWNFYEKYLDIPLRVIFVFFVYYLLTFLFSNYL